MKKLAKLFILCSTLFLSSCYDDSSLWESIREHDSRIVTLEAKCNQMNANISSLKAIVEALKENDYVTSTVPLKENGKEIGYKITLTSGKTLTIYHGKDGIDGINGKDGSTPIIGVKQYLDGVFYWTLNGDWMTDSTGKMIPTTGEDGDNGTTPLLKIDNDSWYVSYNNGSTWNYLYQAVGEDGDSFFSSISHNDSKVTFVLRDGTTIDILKHIDKELDIIFKATDDIFCESGSTTRLEFDIVGGEIAQIHTIGENGWNGEANVNNTAKTGFITIHAPKTSASGKILIFATDTYGHLIMKALTFTDKLLELSTLSYNVPKIGGNIEIEISTNLEYTIAISPEATWISHISTKAVRNETLCFYVSENNNTLGRTAEIKIKSDDGSIVKTIIIYQEGDRFYSSGSGSKTDPYIIETVGQWMNFSDMVTRGNSFKDTYFKLGNNLDFNHTTISSIGTETYPFSGIFDANGYTISNANISGTQNLGIFGYIKNATLVNFTLESISVSGTQHLGILAGYSFDSTIKDAFVSGTINSGEYIGGITGYAYNSTIDGCKNSANVGDFNSQNVGGITGYSKGSHISNSINSGTLVCISVMGGIAGETDNLSSIKNCYNDAQFPQGNIYGMIGGIVGYHCGELYACAMNNSINGMVQVPVNQTGAIVGYDHPGSVCQYCYYIKFTIINKNFTHCGELSWGTWSNYGAYGIDGETSNGYSVTTKLNEWVSSNTNSSKTYKRWSGAIPRFE